MDIEAKNKKRTAPVKSEQQVLLERGLCETSATALAGWLGADPNEWRPVPGFKAVVNCLGTVRRTTNAARAEAGYCSNGCVSLTTESGAWVAVPAIALVGLAFSPDERIWQRLLELAKAPRNVGGPAVGRQRLATMKRPSRARKDRAYTQATNADPRAAGGQS